MAGLWFSARVPIHPIFPLVLRADLAAHVSAVYMHLAGQGRFIPADQQALTYLVQEDEGSLVAHAQVAPHLQGGNALHRIGEENHRRRVDAQRQLVVGEDRAAGHREVFPAGSAAPDHAGRAAVMAVDHTAVRARHLLPVAPAQAPEQRERVIVIHAQHLHQRQGARFGFQEEMPAQGTGSRENMRPSV